MTACAALAFAAPVAVAQTPAASPFGGVTLPGTVPALVGSSALLGPVMGAQPVSLALTLPLRNTSDLSDLLHDLYDAGSPAHGQFLTPQQFTDRFGPTQAASDAVAAFARSKGLAVTSTNPTRTIVNVTGSAATVGQAFGVHLMRYLDPTGREFYAPDADPTLDPSVAGVLEGVIGLDNAVVLRHGDLTAPPAGAAPSVSTGPGGGLTPSAFQTAYGLGGVNSGAIGQTLGLFELANYYPSDIQIYEDHYSLPHVPLSGVYTGNGSIDTSVNGQSEVTLDIELMAAMAPEATRIIVYSAPNDYQDTVNQYSRIASDNAAKEISSSWGQQETVPSGQNNQSCIPWQMVSAENSSFEQMAAQGQSMFVASGDNGAYANGSYLSVEDPGSQPFVCGVGGTRVTLNGDNTWSSETAWSGNRPPAGTVGNSFDGGGGGISNLWPIPAYQSQPGVLTYDSQGSNSARNVPDVSLNAAGNGDSVYYGGQWITLYGTSCAAPIWAGFAALVNQARNAYGLGQIGFVNPYLYQIGRGSRYVADSHDIADGSNNLYYNAGTGYDDATGWGSFNGGNLLADLETTASPAPVPLPFYRLYWPQYNDHYYTTDIADAFNDLKTQFNYEGVQCHIYGGANDVPGLTPLYRLYNGSNHDHFMTTSSAEVSNAQTVGYNYEGVKGYVFPYSYPAGSGPPAGSVPLYRAHNSRTGEHFYTTDYNDYSSRKLPWALEGVRAYVLP